MLQLVVEVTVYIDYGQELRDILCISLIHIFIHTAVVMDSFIHGLYGYCNLVYGHKFKIQTEYLSALQKKSEARCSELVAEEQH